MALVTVNLNDEAIRRAVLEKLEDEEDIRAADKAYAEYLKNPVKIFN